MNAHLINLFVCVAQRDEVAFTRIYKEYKPLLFTCVKKMLKNEQYAEDIVQDVFLKFWQGGESLKEIQNPEGWLRRLAANHTISYLRREARERQMRQLLGQRSDCTPGDTEINFRDLQTIVNKVVMKLPPDTGIILQASIEKGLSRKQIANALNLPVDTVKYKLEYGRQVLREYLKTYTGMYLPWVLIAAAIS